MIIITQNCRICANTDYIEHCSISVKPDAAVIMAGLKDTSITLGRYMNEEEARTALLEMASAEAGGQAIYYMPQSRLTCEQEHKRDARTKRKGGS